MSNPLREMVCLFGDDSDVTVERWDDLWVTSVGGRRFEDDCADGLSQRLYSLQDSGFKVPEWLCERVSLACLDQVNVEWVQLDAAMDRADEPVPPIMVYQMKLRQSDAAGGNHG